MKQEYMERRGRYAGMHVPDGVRHLRVPGRFSLFKLGFVIAKDPREDVRKLLLGKCQKVLDENTKQKQEGKVQSRASAKEKET